MIKILLDPIRLPGRIFYCLVSVAIAVSMAHASGPALTTISDVVYRADGQPAAGTLVISWSAFTTANNSAVAAGELSLTLGNQGALTAALAPNEGAAPAGSYYKVVYKLSDGTTATEYWVVPAASPTTVGAIRARVVPSQTAAQFVTRQYVDGAISGSDSLLLHKTGDESVSGVKSFAVSPTAPTPGTSLAIANKTYVDTTVNSAIGAISSGLVSKGGDTMTGPLLLPADPVSNNQAADRHYVDTQASLAMAAVAQLSYSTLPGRPDTYGFLVNAVVDCGLIGNGVINDGPALQGCINANPGKHVVLPKLNAVGACDYNIGSTNIQLKGHGQILEGIGAGWGGTNTNTTLCKLTADGVAGISVLHSQCQNCAIKNINLNGPSPWSSVTLTQNIPPCTPPAGQSYPAGLVCDANASDGIQVQAAFTTLENVYVSNWGRYGIYITSDFGGFPDDFNLINVTSNDNRGDGLYCKGGDCNAGSSMQFHAYNNQMYGLDDQGFLGNSHYSPQVTGNHAAGSATGTTFAITAVSRSANGVTLTAAGHNVSAGNVVVVAGVTDSSFNGTFSVSSVTSNTVTYAQTAANASSSGGTVRLTSNNEFYAATGIVGGSYNMQQAAAWNTLYSPYCEGGQNPIKGQSKLVIIGGDQGCGIDYTNSPLVIGSGVVSSPVAGPNFLTGSAGFSFLTPSDAGGLLMNWVAGNASDQSIEHRFMGRSLTTYWDWVHNVGPANGQTLTLYRGGNGSHARFQASGPGVGGLNQFNDEGTSTRFNNQTGSSGNIEFYSAGGGQLIHDFLSNGQYAMTPSANNIDAFSIKRFTDTSPTGNFQNFKSAAGSSLWQVDITGKLIAGSMDTARITTGNLNAAQMPALTGDVTTSAGSVAATLAASGVSAGTYNQVTVDAKGRVTAGANPGVSNTSSVTVNAAASTDQNLMSITLPAGSLNAAGKIWTAYAGGVYTTTTSGAGTMTFKAKLCTVSGCGSGTVVTLMTFGPTASQSASASNMPWNIELPILTATTGATGTVLAEGSLNVVLGTTSTSAGAVHVAQTTAASATIDLAAQLFLQFTVADSGSSANDSFKQMVAYAIPLN